MLERAEISMISSPLFQKEKGVDFVLTVQNVTGLPVPPVSECPKPRELPPPPPKPAEPAEQLCIPH